MMRFVKSFALLAASSAFALLLCEALLHMVPGLLPIEVQQVFNYKGDAHAAIGNMPKPDSTGVIVTRDFESPYWLDENGFRNEGGTPEQVDIVVVGDSLVFGYGVDLDSAWPQVLSSKTGESVLNLGLIGASPQQYRKIHQIYSRPMKPKTIVVGFFARNDFWDAEKYAGWERSGVGGNYLVWRGFGMPSADQFRNPVYRIIFELRKRSYVLALVKFGRDALSPNATTEPTELSLANGSKMLLHSDDFYAKTSLAEPNNETFVRVVDEFRQIRDTAARDGTRLVVLLQPAKEEVYRVSDSESLPDASAALREQLQQLGIEYIDAAPAFRRLAEEGEVLYFATDGHPNAKGNAVFAELVADYLDVPKN